MPNLTMPPELLAIVNKWRRAMYSLQDAPFKPLSDQEQLLKTEKKYLKNFNAAQGKLHRDNDIALYSKNASFILDYVAFYTIDVIFNMIGTYDDGYWGMTQAAAGIPLHCREWIDPAAYYLDDATCVPHITSEKLYQKMQWLEWILTKVDNHIKEDGYSFIVSTPVTYFINKRLAPTTNRINEYAAAHGIKRLTIAELESEFDAKELNEKSKEEKEEKIPAAAQDSFPKTLPIFASSDIQAEQPSHTAANKDKLIEELRAYAQYLRKHFIQNNKEYDSYFYGAFFNYPASTKLQAAEQLIRILQGQEVVLSPEEINALQVKTLRTIIQRHEHHVDLPAELTTQENQALNKQNLMQELQSYISTRLAEKISSQSDHYYFWAITGYSARTKTSAANKMLKLLGNSVVDNENEAIEFEDDELGALREGTLGNLLIKYEKYVNLPAAFIAAEAENAPQQQLQR